MILDCTYERLNILSTSELVKLRSIAKEIINERYAKYPPKTKSVFCTKCNGAGLNVVDMGDFNHNICCPICKGKGRILVTIQNDEEDCEEVKVMDRYNIVDTLTKGKDRYPAGTFWVGYPDSCKSEGITYNSVDSSKFRDQYPKWQGYTYFKWVDIKAIDPIEYDMCIMDSNKKLIKNIRKHIGANNDHDIIISYNNKTYFAPAQYSASLFGYSVLSTYSDLSRRLNYRVEIENRKHRIRTFDLGNSCIDTGKTIYVGSDECHTCKCYNGSNGKNIKCAIHRLGKK